jgi:hypothetical protein
MQNINPPPLIAKMPYLTTEQISFGRGIAALKAPKTLSFEESFPAFCTAEKASPQAGAGCPQSCFRHRSRSLRIPDLSLVHDKTRDSRAVQTNILLPL